MFIEPALARTASLPDFSLTNNWKEPAIINMDDEIPKKNREMSCCDFQSVALP